MGGEAVGRSWIEVGDAVVPKNEPDHDVLTVFDFRYINHVRHARCNWVIGPKDLMRTRDLPVEDLARVRRACDVD
jgi:hypothetical protein